jgi:cellulose synthase/poly-beta-1,6-N-acetylglucosamine synthase-like glycosyltransferase
MMAVFVAILLASGLCYAFAIGAFAVGFQRVVRETSDGGERMVDSGRRPVNQTPSLPFVSVIVPARDEAAAIGLCLDSVFAGDYPADRFEVIVVDDLSRDATPAVVRRKMERLNRVAVLAGFEDDEPEQRLRLVQISDEEDRARAHKKRAIERGIAEARGEIICTTDADCLVPTGWLRALVARFDDETALVSGPVLYPTGGAAANVEALEFLGLVAVGAGAIGAGRPNLCNGANVAYRKDVFESLGGFSGIDHLTSGDDELLMQKIAYTTGWGVRFCADRAAAVLTEAPATPRAFFEQRRRWASKGAHYPHPALVALVAAIYAFYVALLGGLVALPFVPALAGPLAAGFALKVVPEVALLGPACRHFGRGRLMAYFLPAQFLQLPYVVVIGAAGALGGYEWKGRRIER